MKEQLELKPQDERRGGTSASNAQADLLCQGRHQAQMGLPDVPSEDAEFGKAIHAALATGLDEGLDTQQLSIVESCREIEARLVLQAFAHESNKVKAFREQRYWCLVPDGDKRHEHSAKPDYVGRVGPKGLILEYKTLPGDLPDSPENLQLRDQVVLAARSLLMTDLAVAIIQPLVTQTPQVCVYEAEDIDRAEKEMWERVRKSNAPNAPRTAGEVQCKFCKAKSICHEYALWSKSMLPAPVNIFDVPVAQWTPEQRAMFCERESVARKWLDECRAEMKAMLKANPGSIPGWQLEPGDTRSTITNPRVLFQRFNTLAWDRAVSMAAEQEGVEEGTKRDELILEWFMQCVSITKGKLEGQVRNVTGAKGKGLSAEMKKLLGGLTEEKQNEPSLGRVK